MQIIVFLILWLLITVQLVANAQARQFVGYAYDLKTGELYYAEHHQRQFDEKGKKQVTTAYINAEQQEIAQRIVHFQQGQVVKFTMTDKLSGSTMMVERVDTAVLLQKQSPQQETMRVRLAYRDALDHVIDAGFNNYVLKHWDQLQAGESVTFNFLSTERQRWVTLSLKDLGVRYIDGVAIRGFQMTLANPILRLLMKPIKVEYYADTQELYRYQGISNLKREDGKNYVVRIEFPQQDYQPLAQRP